MHDLLIELAVPSLHEIYDVTIPAATQVHIVLSLLVQAVQKLSDERFQAVEPVLCDSGSGSILPVNQTPEQLGLQNGARLLLI